MSMVLIQRQVLSSSASSVTFSNIPQNYKTLRLVVSSRGTNNDLFDSIYYQFNNTTPNFTLSTSSGINLQGWGSSVTSATNTSTTANAITNGNTTTSNTFGSAEILIPNYAGTANKVTSSDSVSETNGTTAYQRLAAFLWSDSNAITSITLSPGLNQLFVTGSSFSLYGLI